MSIYIFRICWPSSISITTRFWLPSIVDIGFTYSTVVLEQSLPVRVETVVRESLTMTHDVDLRPVPSLTQDATEGGHLSANTCEGRRLKKPSPASLGLVSSLTPSPDILVTPCHRSAHQCPATLHCAFNLQNSTYIVESYSTRTR